MASAPARSFPSYPSPRWARRSFWVEAQDLDLSRSGLDQDLDLDRSGFHSPQSGAVDGPSLDVAVEVDREVALSHLVSPFGFGFRS